MTDNKGSISISLSLMNPPRRLPIELPSSASSSELHKLVSDATTIPLSGIRLIFRGKMIPSLEEGNVIDSFKLSDGCVVHCMGKPSVTPGTNTSGVSTSTASSRSVNAASIGSVVTPPPPSSSAAAASIGSSNNNNNSCSTASNVANTSEKDPLVKALEVMKSNHSSSEYTTALTTISKILSNIISNPTEEKYRKVKRSNAAFTKRLGRLTKSHEAMLSIGFVSSTSSEGNEEYSLVPNAEAWTKLTKCKKVIDDLIQKHNQETSNIRNNFNAAGGRNQDMGFGAIPPPANNTNNMFPNLGGMGLGGNLPPTPQMVESMLSNPAALQSMLSNPMMQNMMMNDPRMRNNPMMQNAMRELMNNPGMVQQMTQMMSNPAVRSRMTQMMQQQGVMGDDSADMSAQMEMMRQFANMASMQNSGNTSSQQNATGSTANQQAPMNSSNQQQQQNGENNDSEREMTEEEMIAEAIARSLREQ